MSIAKLKAAVANAPLTLTEAGLSALDELIPSETLAKLDQIINQDIPPSMFQKVLEKFLTPEEVAKFQTALTTAAQPNYIACAAGDWLNACNQLGPEHTGPNTAGEIAKMNALTGMRITVSGQVAPLAANLNLKTAAGRLPVGTIQMSQPNAKRIMKFHVGCHVKPLMDAIAKFEADTVKTADGKVA